MSFRIASTQALEILDSRSRPTLEVTVTFADGTVAVAGVPSGASTGSGEAVERRDGDASRFGGAGVLGGVGSVNGEINEALAGREFTSHMRRTGSCHAAEEVRGYGTSAPAGPVACRPPPDSLST